MHGYFLSQMAMYASYHRDRRNKMTHFVGVPAIVFAILIPMAMVDLWTTGGYTVTLATVFVATVLIYYLLCDFPLGIAMTVVNLPLLLLATWVAELGAATAWTAFAVLFIGGWIFQLVGHIFEGRKPALLDNLLQIFIAPMFLAAEVAVASGWRGDLARAMQEGIPDNAQADVT